MFCAAAWNGEIFMWTCNQASVPLLFARYLPRFFLVSRVMRQSPAPRTGS
jgi:hypothetical protein